MLCDLRIFFVVSLLALIGACKKNKTTDPPVVAPVHMNEVNLVPYFGNEVLHLDSIYTFPNGTKIQVLEFKAYFQGFVSGSTSIFDYGLYDYRAHGKLVFLGAGPFPASNNATFNIGVPSTDNHSDPSTWPNNHPLNIANSNDMHWDWNPGYIFFKIEAKVDTIPDQNLVLDQNLIYHIGTDAYFSQKNLSNVVWQALDNKHQLNLKFNAVDFFQSAADPIDFSSETSSHSAAGQELLSEKIRQLFINALTTE